MGIYMLLKLVLFLVMMLHVLALHTSDHKHAHRDLEKGSDSLLPFVAIFY